MREPLPLIPHNEQEAVAFFKGADFGSFYIGSKGGQSIMLNDFGKF